MKYLHAKLDSTYRAMDDDIWVVSFLDYDLDYFDAKGKRVEPIADPFGLQ